jgi:hypothetical protein
MMQEPMKKEILEDRLRELGWSPYRVAKEIARIRGEAEQMKRPTRYATAVRQAMENPDNSSLKTIESLIAAMGGQLFIRWEQKEEVITGAKEVQIEYDLGN